jgi:hypothetical protein
MHLKLFQKHLKLHMQIISLFNIVKMHERKLYFYNTITDG